MYRIIIALIVLISSALQANTKNNQPSGQNMNNLLSHILKSDQANFQTDGNGHIEINISDNYYLNLPPLLDQNNRELIAQKYTAYKKNFVEYTTNHKQVLLVSSLIGIYSYLWIQFFKARWRLLRSESWCNWHAEYSMEELIQLSQKQLALDLLTTIQQRYQTDHDVTDFLSPLMHFLQEINHELAIFSFCINRYATLQKLYLTVLFPFQGCFIDRAQEAHQRLLYLKNIFLSWITEYKITTNIP